MSHPVDLVRWYLGPIRDVQAFGTQSQVARQYNARSFDIYIANYRNDRGQLGRAMGHYGLHELPSARNALELVLYGDGGTSMAQYHDMRYFHTGPDGTEMKSPRSKLRGICSKPFTVSQQTAGYENLFMNQRRYALRMAFILLQ